MIKTLMKKVAPLMLVAIMIASTCLASIAIAQEATAQTSGAMQFQYNAQRTGDYSAVAGSVPSNGELKWSYPIGGLQCTPMIANGILYVGSDDDNVYALDANTGALKWRYKAGGDVHAAPAVVNGVVYIGSDDYNVYALGANDGTLKWIFTTNGQVESAPAVVNGVVYIGDAESTAIGDGNNLYALDAETGALKWSYRTAGKMIGGGIEFTPAVANGIVYVGSDEGIVHALDAETGALKWKYSLSNQDFDPIFSSPAVANGIVYITCHDKYVYALDAETGALKWSYRTGAQLWSSPAVANSVVYVASDNLYALDAETGALKWSYPIGLSQASSPIIANGIVYVGGGTSHVYAIDATTGALKWRSADIGWIGYSSPSVANGVVYIGGGGGRIYAIGNQVMPNQPPTAEAGSDQPSAHIGAQVTLQGSGTDPDNNLPLGYSWSIKAKPDGSTATLSGDKTTTPSFIPDIIGDYTIALVVTDSLGAASTPDEVIVHADNAAPTAMIASSAQMVKAKSTVQLDASGSSDPNPDDDDSLHYAWTLTTPDKSKAQLSDGSIVNPTLKTDKAGTYKVQLVVTDDHGAYSTAEVTITAVNKMPK